MKKLFIITAFAICLLSVSSCRWIHETFYSVEGCTEWYLDEIYEAGLDGDVDKAEERNRQYQEWINGLSSSDQKRVDKAALKWLDSHPVAAAAVLEFLDYYDDYYYDDYYYDDYYYGY